MRNQAMLLSALIASILLLISGNAFLMTLLGVRLSLERLNPATIGWIMAAYSAGFVIGTLYANRVIARVGHIRAFAAFAAITAAVALMHPLWLNAFWWGALRLTSGAAMAGLLLVLESWFSSRATNSNRSTLFAVYLVTSYLGSASGQLLINLGDPLSFKLFSISALLLIAALIPLALTRLPAPALEQIHHFPLRRLIHTAPLAFTASLLAGLVIGSFYALAPLYAERTGLGLGALSTFMFASILAAMGCAWPLGRLCDRFERRKVLFWIALGAALSSAGVALFGHLDLRLLLLGSLPFMGLAAGIYPIAVAILNDRIDSHHIVSASAGLLLAYGLGSCLGPLVSSLLMSISEPGALFATLAAALLGLALVTRYWMRHVDPLPVSAQEEFVIVPATSPVIAEIDPRNESFHE